MGAEAVRLLAAKGFEIVGIDNDMRRAFFGPEASTAWQVEELTSRYRSYSHLSVDIRNADAINALFSRYGRSISVVVHCAGQPSHDWAAREPMVDFGINATGTLVLLEAVRQHAADAVVVFASTNKVYGDHPNRLPFVELETRYELCPEHPWAEHGIPEEMSTDNCLHSVFGSSKLSADVLVQEYGRYFGIRTGCFRCGCITGSGHSGVELHGFLSYLVKCAINKKPYCIIGYDGKQVRDNIHAKDLVSAFWNFIERPMNGEIFNIGGARDVNCSILEAINIIEKIIDIKINVNYTKTKRIGDHQWWISDTRKFVQFIQIGIIL